MRILLLIQFIIILSTNLFGQETKLIVKINSDLKKSKETKPKDRNTVTIRPGFGFVEEYYVLKSDENIRHGTYVKYRPILFGGIQVFESGSYQNGEPSGLWEYFYDFPGVNTANSIREKGVYANGLKNGVWTTYYMDTIPKEINEEKFGSKKKTDSINISINHQSAKIQLVGMYLNGKRVGEWTSFNYSGEAIQKFNFSKKILILDSSIKDSINYNTNRKALFIGGLPSLIYFLSHEFKLSGDLMTKIKSDSSTVIVSFTVEKDGGTTEPKIESSTGNKGLEDEALRVAALTNNKWIPAISEGTAVNSIYKIQFFIIEKKISPTSKQFKIGYKPIFD